MGKHPAPAARALRRSRRASVSRDLWGGSCCCCVSGFREGGFAAAAEELAEENAEATAAAAATAAEEAPAALNRGTGGGGAAALAAMTWLSTAYAAGCALLIFASAFEASEQRATCDEKASVVAATEAAAAAQHSTDDDKGEEDEHSFSVPPLDASSSDIALEIAAAWMNGEGERFAGVIVRRAEGERNKREREMQRKNLCLTSSALPRKLKAASKLSPELARDRASTLYLSESRVRQRDELRKPRRAASSRWKSLDTDGGDGEQERSSPGDEDKDEARQSASQATSAGRDAAAAAALSRRLSSSCLRSAQ